LKCSIHDIFEQSIHNHFNIGNNKRTKLSELAESKLKKCKLMNGTKQCSILNCKEHGKFKSTINNTLKYGCSECNRIKNLNLIS
jgi:ribosomal protein L44E